MNHSIDRRKLLGAGGAIAASTILPAWAQSPPNIRFAAVFSDKDIRAAIAHDEIVAAADMPRYAALDVTPVLSMQWGKPAGDTLGLVDIFGPERMAVIEPSGLLAAQGARVAFGSV